MRSGLALAALFVLAAGPASAQSGQYRSENPGARVVQQNLQTDPPTPGGQPTWIAEVKLDDTGIASWRYLNQRLPAHLLRDLQDQVITDVLSANPAAADRTRIREKRAEIFTDWLRTTAFDCGSFITNPTGGYAPVPGQKFAEEQRGRSPVLTLTNPVLPFWVRFRNRSVTHDMVVTVTAPMSKETAKACVAEVPKTDKSASLAFDEPGRGEAHWDARIKDEQCVISLKVDAGSFVDVDVWKLADVIGLRPFNPDGASANAATCTREAKREPIKVSVDPYDQEVKFPRAQGAFILVDPPKEPADKMSWKSSLSAGPTWEPGQDYVEGSTTDLQKFSPEQRYDGQRFDHFPANGFLTFGQSLSDMAAATLTVGYKKGDLGTDALLAVREFKVTAWGLRGVSLDVGRFEFSRPTSGIAGVETGEGARLNYHFLSAGRVVQREGALKKADINDQDRASWVFEARGIPLVLGGGLEGLSLFWFEGNDRCDAPEEKAKKNECGTRMAYRTFGGELGFGVPGSNVSGSLGLFRSKRDGGQQASGRGHVGLATMSYTRASRPGPHKPLEVSWVGILRYGQGSADDPSTIDRNEGYLGEGGSFLPGTILPALVDKIAFASPGVLGKGLTNKRYFGAEAKWRRFSPLRFLVAAIGKERDIASEATTARVHTYRQLESVGDPGLGREWELAFDIESPKGVRWNVTGSLFLRSDALEAYLDKDPWAVSASLVVATGR